MKRLVAPLMLCASIGLGLFLVQGQQPADPKRGKQAGPNADPYANNAAPGTLQFPLAAPAGKDSGATTKAPAGATNQGIIDEKAWKYGHNFDAPADAKIWNPVKLKMIRRSPPISGVLFRAAIAPRLTRMWF